MTERTRPELATTIRATVDGDDVPVPVPVAVRLEYNIRDPWAVTMEFIDHDVRWVFARDLLLTGLYRPTGGGDVHVTPEGWLTRVTVQLRSHQKQVQVQLPKLDVHQFLLRTLHLVPAGAEPELANWDGFIASVLEQQA